MKRFSIIFSLLLLLVALTTFNPKYSNLNFGFFKIKEIKVENIKVLNENKLKNLIYEELIDLNLLFFDQKKIKKILEKNELIDYIEIRKIYPSKLKVIIFEKEAIAIINNKQFTNYLIKDGEEIKFFKNQKLEVLPNIFGEKKNFLEVYSALIKLDFPISQIKSFYYFDIGRWDIILKNKKVIKLPIKNFTDSLKNFMELDKKINFEKYSIFDYRIKDQLILN